MKRQLFLALVIGLGVVSLSPAADWPQFQGPDRNNISKEVGLLKSWPKEGPALAWKFDKLGIGYSSPAVVGDRLYIAGTVNGDEHLFCLTTAGKEQWKTKIGKTFDFKGNQWGAGPRATPTVAGETVLILGSQGDLVCVGAKDGKEHWRKSMVNDLKGEIITQEVGPPKMACGYSWSPLVDGDNVICVPGGAEGSVAALKVKTGDLVWRTKQLVQPASYASPVVAEIGGVRQYVVLFNEGLAGIDAKAGTELWYHARKPAFTDFVIATPVVQGNQVFFSAGPNGGCELVEVSKTGEKFTTNRVYANKIMKNPIGGFVLVDGHVYGYSDRRGWICYELLLPNKMPPDKEVWAERRKLGAGSVICADGHLYILDEDNAVVALVEVNKSKYTEKGRFELPQRSKNNAPSARTWTRPVIADGHLYVRDQELLFCYKIK